MRFNVEWNASVLRLLEFTSVVDPFFVAAVFDEADVLAGDPHAWGQPTLIPLRGKVQQYQFTWRHVRVTLLFHFVAGQNAIRIWTSRRWEIP